MTIGIINAGDSELAPFLETLTVKGRTQKAMLTFYECEFGGKRLITLFSGVCKVNAAIAAQLLTDLFQPDVIISAGTCGGLGKDVEVFDTIAAIACVYHDVEETILTEFHPWLEFPFFPCSGRLLEQAGALRTPHPLRFGMIATGEYFLESNEQRNALLARYPEALGVDMESCAIAHVCHVNGVPFLSVRTVTDNGKIGGSAAFEENVDKASRISMEICLELVRKL